MATTNATIKEFTDDESACDNDWCNGPESETLPCFACFDRTRDYETGVRIDPEGE